MEIEEEHQQLCPWKIIELIEKWKQIRFIGCLVHDDIRFVFSTDAFALKHPIACFRPQISWIVVFQTDSNATCLPLDIDSVAAEATYFMGFENHAFRLSRKLRSFYCFKSEIERALRRDNLRMRGSLKKVPLNMSMPLWAIQCHFGRNSIHWWRLVMCLPQKSSLAS